MNTPTRQENREACAGFDPVTGSALFVPLKTQFFEAFKRGEKQTEFRRYGARWNEKTCRIGRRITLSKGYGKYARLAGTISSFDVRTADDPSVNASCFHATPLTLIACIGVTLDAQND